MLPYYTKQEIINEVMNKIERLNLSKRKLLKDFNVDYESLKSDFVWSVKEYEAIANFLNVTLESLTGIHKSEDLNSVSFRAQENTDEINHHVRKLDDIFTDLAYQIKVGGEECGR